MLARFRFGERRDIGIGRNYTTNFIFLSRLLFALEPFGSGGAGGRVQIRPGEESLDRFCPTRIDSGRACVLQHALDFVFIR